MSVRFLSTNNFFIQNTSSGNHLCHNIGGISCIMFTSPKCHYCNQFKPQFMSMSNIVRSCTFAIADVGTNAGIIALARESSTKIEYVPLIIIYNDGMPVAIYSGDLDSQMLASFIHNMQSKSGGQMPQQNSFSSNDADVDKAYGGFAEYNCDSGVCMVNRGGVKSNVCYLTFEEAYPDTTTSNAPHYY